MERLQKVIAQSGYTSRRKAEELIRNGQVKVNGEVVTTLGTKVSSSDYIEINGHILEREEKVYYVFYKPKHVISTVSDEHNRPTVIDYFQDVPERIYPVGRLDYDSSGLLLMTNDGEFANLMMHPSSHVEKIYDITVKGIVRESTVKKLERGIYLDGAKTLPCRISIEKVDRTHSNTRIYIALVEGKNRQVRRMFETLGYRVTRLHRMCIGPVTLEGMVPGEYRRLKPKEMKQLYFLANKKVNESHA